MSGRGEQGEHFGTSSVLFPRVLAKNRETGLLLTLLTPESHPTSWNDQCARTA